MVKKLKYEAIFLRKIGEYKKKEKDKQGKIKTITRPNYVLVGRKRFKETDETISFDKDNSFPVQIEAYSHQINDTLCYFYDFDDMSLIGLDVLLKYNMKPKDLNKITGKRIVEQIVAGAKNVQGNPLIYILLPLLIGIAMLFIGYWMGGGFNSPT